MRITLNGLDYAIRFTRDGDKKTYCDIKVGEVGQNPKEMPLHFVGSAQRMAVDEFNKAEGFKLALERALKAINEQYDHLSLDMPDGEAPVLEKADRVKIWAAFRKWLQDSNIKTSRVIKTGFDLSQLPVA